MIRRRKELTICPLGGMGEIGKNMTVIGFGGKYIVVDCGLKFPEEDMLGIDFVIPDVSFLMDNRENILAFIITHGHEDHIGALPFVLPKLNVPVYCTRLTAGLIENKLSEACPHFKPRFQVVEHCDKVKIADFEVEFIELCHSIPDSCALAITTPLGIIFHSGDFKFDTTPTDGVSPDFSALARIGDKGVLLAMVDSTNVERSGFTPSEKCTRETFDKLFRRYKDRRILVATFASNLNRIASIITVSQRFNRKVLILGRSMVANVDLACRLGYMKIPEGMLITAEEARKIAPNRVTVITTGSQGEPFSGLVIMSRNSHKQVTLGEKDVVIISATPIPGNEKLVSDTINRLFELGVEVVYSSYGMGQDIIHVSGHASREELKLLFSLIRPKFFVPCHGEYRHLVHHAALAREMGVSARNVFVLKNGEVLSMTTNTKAVKGRSVQTGAILIDGIALGEFEKSIVRERRDLGEKGIVTISVVLGSHHNLLAEPQVETRGTVRNSETRRYKKEFIDAVKDAVAQLQRTPGADVADLPTEIRKRIRHIYGRTTRDYPTIVPLVTVLKR